KLEERNYPVDLGAPQVEVHNINISIPKGFTLSNKPKDSAMTLPENSAKYSFRSLHHNNIPLLQQTITLNKAIFTSEEYFHLKEFFSRIIQQQMTDFQFNKI